MLWVRLVFNRISKFQRSCDMFQGACEVFRFLGDECRTAGFFRQFLQNCHAARRIEVGNCHRCCEPSQFGFDLHGKDRDIMPLSGFDNRRERDAAEIVVAITDHDQHPLTFLRRELLLDQRLDGVDQSCSAIGANVTNAPG